MIYCKVWLNSVWVFAAHSADRKPSSIFNAKTCPAYTFLFSPSVTLSLPLQCFHLRRFVFFQLFFLSCLEVETVVKKFSSTYLFAIKYSRTRNYTRAESSAGRKIVTPVCLWIHFHPQNQGKWIFPGLRGLTRNSADQGSIFTQRKKFNHVFSSHKEEGICKSIRLSLSLICPVLLPGRSTSDWISETWGVSDGTNHLLIHPREVQTFPFSSTWNSPPHLGITGTRASLSPQLGGTA